MRLANASELPLGLAFLASGSWATSVHFICYDARLIFSQPLLPAPHFHSSLFGESQIFHSNHYPHYLSIKDTTLGVSGSIELVLLKVY